MGLYDRVRHWLSVAYRGGVAVNFTWQQAWDFAKSQPYDLQTEIIYSLNVEIYSFLAFASNDVQLEVLQLAPDYIIGLFKDKRRKYVKIVDGKEHIGYLPIIKPDVLAQLDRGKTESRKSNRKGCHHK